MHFKIYVNGKIVCKLLFSLHIKFLKCIRVDCRKCSVFLLTTVECSTVGTGHGGLAATHQGAPKLLPALQAAAPQWPHLCQPWRAERPPPSTRQNRWLATCGK